MQCVRHAAGRRILKILFGPPCICARCLNVAFVVKRDMLSTACSVAGTRSERRVWKRHSWSLRGSYVQGGPKKQTTIKNRY